MCAARSRLQDRRDETLSSATRHVYTRYRKRSHAWGIFQARQKNRIFREENIFKLMMILMMIDYQSQG